MDFPLLLLLCFLSPYIPSSLLIGSHVVCVVKDDLDTIISSPASTFPNAGIIVGGSVSDCILIMSVPFFMMPSAYVLREGRIRCCKVHNTLKSLILSLHSSRLVGSEISVVTQRVVSVLKLIIFHIDNTLSVQESGKYRTFLLKTLLHLINIH